MENQINVKEMIDAILDVGDNYDTCCREDCDTIVGILLPLIKKYIEQDIKNFAERLKEKAYQFPCAIGVEYAVPFCKIDETLNELLGE